jgi:exodeoxyribonuclease VII large subunit
MASTGTLELDFGGGREILSVSELNREARRVIETHFGTIWVEGEISNLARPGSGHLYWSLKDSDAQVRCAMFRQYGRNLGFAPDNGQQVLVRARVSLYEARGEFQLIVDYMEEAGEGLLRRRFEALKARLASEGLFEAGRKHPLPPTPRRIGVVTSPTGAAIRDVLTALRRRFPAVGVLIYPSAVQGEGAAESLAAALKLAAARRDCDLLILTRGGGSLEDLWAFNEEVLARAIAEISIPVVCGVGHETDFTIADFVADLRAPTPSQAAELSVPDQRDWLARLSRTTTQLARAARQTITLESRRVDALSHRLQRAHPGVVLGERAQRLDELAGRMAHAAQRRLAAVSTRLDRVAGAVRAANPVHRVRAGLLRAAQLRARLVTAVARQTERTRTRLQGIERTLQTLGPAATLERGYAVVTSSKSGAIVRDSRAVRPGEGIDVRVARGRLAATIDRSEEESG